MIDNVYSRQLPSLELLIPQSVAIVGCGGVGAWAGIFTAMSGIKEIYLFDSDIIEESNLNRLPYTFYEIGEKKTDALRDSIKRIRPSCIVHCFENIGKITLSILLSNRVEAVLACTDNLKSQIMLHNYCKKEDIRFVRAGYDGNHITLLNHIPSWIGKKDTEGGYTITPSWVVPSSIIGSLAVYSLCKKRLKLTGLLDNIMVFEDKESERIEDNDDFNNRVYHNPNSLYGYSQRRRRSRR